MAVATPSTQAQARAGRMLGGALGASRSAAGLLVALVVACGYAAFARGATQLPDEARLQVLLVALGLVGGALWFGRGRLEIVARREALVGVGLLGAFALWTGLSLLWSVAPDQTWVEVNRWIAYALVALLALAVGSSAPHAIERLAVSWLVVAMCVALYALATKLTPGLHVFGIIDLNQEADFSRLRAPLDYWNALALVCVLAAPVAIRLAVDRTRGPRARLASLASLYVLIVVGGLTYSRGGVLAFVVALIVLTALGGGRLRGLAAVGLACLAAVPVLVYAFTSHALTTDGEPLGVRDHAGHWLALIVLGSLVALLLAGRQLLPLEGTIGWNARRSWFVWRGLALAGVAALAIGVLGLAVSHRGLSGSISHQVDSFTQARKDPITDPGRLLSTNSGNRWVWWKEALGAWSHKPLDGWGAGSFPVTHLMYRKYPPLPVKQPHNVFLQLLAETGLVGLLLAAGALGALLAAAWARVRSLAPGRERDLAVALLAACVAWTVHGFFDWDTDIPAATLPALLFLGVLAARPGERRGGSWVAEPSSESRAVVLGLGSLLLCAVAVSAILPSWAHSKALGALTSVGDRSTPAALAHDQAQADLAARLNPLSVEGFFNAATIAGRRGRPGDQRRYLLQAVDRQPYNAQAWERLAALAISVNDQASARVAARRALSLDPLNPQLQAIEATTEELAIPPADSATATGTPLPAPIAPAASAAPSATAPNAALTPSAATTPPAGTTPGAPAGTSLSALQRLLQRSAAKPPGH